MPFVLGNPDIAGAVARIGFYYGNMAVLEQSWVRVQEKTFGKW